MRGPHPHTDTLTHTHTHTFLRESSKHGNLGRWWRVAEQAGKACLRHRTQGDTKTGSAQTSAMARSEPVRAQGTPIKDTTQGPPARHRVENKKGDPKTPQKQEGQKAVEVKAPCQHLHADPQEARTAKRGGETTARRTPDITAIPPLRNGRAHLSKLARNNI